jgi:hypothetical protein
MFSLVYLIQMAPVSWTLSDQNETIFQHSFIFRKKNILKIIIFYLCALDHGWKNSLNLTQ